MLCRWPPVLVNERPLKTTILLKSYTAIPGREPVANIFGMVRQ